MPAWRTRLFRAVTLAEYLDIIHLRAFRNPEGIENKYFAETLQGAERYALLAEEAFGEELPKAANGTVVQILVRRGTMGVAYVSPFPEPRFAAYETILKPGILLRVLDATPGALVLEAVDEHADIPVP